MATTLETKFDPQGALYNRTMQSLILAVCIKKLGGSVTITQELIDEVAYGYILEEQDPVTFATTLSWKDRSKQG